MKTSSQLNAPVLMTATLIGRALESLTANDRRQTQVVNFSNQEISR